MLDKNGASSEVPFFLLDRVAVFSDQLHDFRGSIADFISCYFFRGSAILVSNCNEHQAQVLHAFA